MAIQKSSTSQNLQKKAWILALCLAAGMPSVFAQDKVTCVKLSQSRTQDLGSQVSNAANKNCNSATNGSELAGISPHTTNDIVGRNHNGTSVNWNAMSGGSYGKPRGSYSKQSDNTDPNPKNQSESGINQSWSSNNCGSGSSNNNQGGAGVGNNNSSKSNQTQCGNQNSKGGSSSSMNGGTATACPSTTMQAFIDNFPETRCTADTSFGGMMIHVPAAGGISGHLSNPTTTFMRAPISWPNVVPGGAALLATTSVGAANNIPAAIRMDGTGPVTASQMAAIASAAASFAATAPMMPDARLQSTKEEQNAITQQQADNAGDMEKQQAGAAINYVRTALENFTVDADNKWNKLRNELFMPIAVLLLLPGAVAAQVKAIVSSSFPIFEKDINPLEGLIRSIVAIFLIPGCYLIVNYGIDVSNSIAYTIHTEYERIFNGDMYRDAECAHIRAFGTRLPNENLGYIPNKVASMAQTSTSVRGKFEQGNLDVKIEDPCAGLYNAPADKANENVPYAVNAQRSAYNSAAAAMAMTWNILCAFQMCYLHYLWFVGPIMAALWVYPVSQLRQAFPNWCEGVLTICFWSLFWNTVIVLMACFRGIDDTGTVMMEALNFLATACVKYAFDFSSLVKAAGDQAAKMASSSGSSGGGGSKGGSSSSGKGSSSGNKSNSTTDNIPKNGSADKANSSAADTNVRLSSAFSPSDNQNKQHSNLDKAQQAPPPNVQSPAGQNNAVENPQNPGNVSSPSLFSTESPFGNNPSSTTPDVSSPPMTNTQIDTSSLNAPLGPLSLSDTQNFAPNASDSTLTSMQNQQSDQQLQQSQQAQAQMQQTQLQQELQQQSQQQQQQHEQQMQQQMQQQQTQQYHQAVQQDGYSAANSSNYNFNTSLSATPAAAIEAALGFIPPPQASHNNMLVTPVGPGLDQNAPVSNPIASQQPDSTYARSSQDITNAMPVSSAIDYSSVQTEWRRLFNDAESSSNAIYNTALPVPEASSTAANLYRDTANVVDCMPVVPANNNIDNARTVDLPDKTEKVTVDGGVVDASDSSNLARSSTVNSFAQDAFSGASSNISTAGTTISNSFSEQSMANASATQMLQSQYKDTNAGYIAFTQKQNTALEEQRRTVNQKPSDQLRKTNNQKILDQLKQNYKPMNLTSAGAPPSSSSNKSARNAKEGEQDQNSENASNNDSQTAARMTLAEQIMYQNIRNRQRKAVQMSDIELDLMKKLGHTSDGSSSAEGSFAR